jgi:diguanylate cyclase (GGDEF)-like protein
MLDVDHFKKLNDRHGHVAGDLMLSTLGQALRGVLRRDDAVARYGGEEFAMILPGTPLHSATEAVPRICDAVNGATVEHRDSLLRVTVSGGLATVQKGEAATSLIDRADAALYAAKSAGRDRVYMHDGAACLPVTGAERHDQPLDRSEPAGASAEMAEHIPSGPTDFDDVASDEEISAALVKSCEELREYMQQREQPELSTGKT